MINFNNVYKINLYKLFFYFLYFFFFFGVFNHNIFIQPINFIILNSLISFILINFFYFAQKNTLDFNIVINRKYIFLILFFFIINLIINYNFLLNSPFSDEFIYIKYSFLHSINLINIFDLNYFDDFKFKNIIFVTNLILVIIVITIFILFKFLNSFSKIFLLISFLLLFRVLISYFGENLYPHSPFNGIFVFLFSLFFGLNNLTINISNIFVFSIFLFSIYIYMKSISITFLNRILITIFISTIPSNIFLISHIDHSFFGFIFISLIVLLLVDNNKIEDEKLLFLIILGSLFRVTIFFLIIPFFFKLFLSKKFLLPKEKLYYYISLISVPLPFLFLNVLYSESSGNIFQIIYSIKSNFAFLTIYENVSWVNIILFFIFALCLNFKKIIMFYFCSIFLFAIYFSINPDLLGLMKYKSEYFIPLSICSFIILIKFYSSKFNKFVITFYILLLIIFNTANNIKNSSELKSNEYVVENYFLENKKPFFYHKLHYDYNNAYSYIVSKNIQNNTLNLDVTYGIFPEILYNYTYTEIKELIPKFEKYKKYKVNNDIAWTSTSVDYFLEHNKVDINYVLIGFLFPNKQKIINQFKQNGWIVEKVFHNKNFDSKLYLLKNNNSKK